MPLALVACVALAVLLREDPSAAAIYTAPDPRSIDEIVVLPSAVSGDEAPSFLERADRRLVAEELG